MIIKSLSRKSNPAQLIKYATRYLVKEGKNKGMQKHMNILVKHNIRSNSADRFIAEFKENESFRIYRRKDSVVLFHTILSFNPEDKTQISKVILKDIAKKFIELRGANCLNLAVAHLETNHKHIHVLTSGVQVNGRSGRVSKQTFAHILKELEEYQQQKYPQLIHSKNSHSLIKATDKEKLLEHFKATRKTQKLLLHKEMDVLLKNAQSIDDFKNTLSLKGYEPYYRNGKLQGILLNGKKYRFSNLGFDTKDLDSLQTKSQFQEQGLSELRTARNKESEKEMVKVENEKSENTIDKEMESIESIRRKSKEKEGIERENTRNEWTTPNIGITHDFGT